MLKFITFRMFSVHKSKIHYVAKSLGQQASKTKPRGFFFIIISIFGSLRFRCEVLTFDPKDARSFSVHSISLHLRFGWGENAGGV